MRPLDVDIHAAMSAAYVHIPFCSAICPYCDFAVVAGADDRIERYVDAVISEIGIPPGIRHPDLADDGVDVALDPIIRVGDDCEVAIWANGRAERDVNVGGAHRGMNVHLERFHMSSSTRRAATNASWGTSTEPTIFIRFLPSFCLVSSFFLRVTSPP